MKLVDMFDICEELGDRHVLHQIFDVFYALGTL
jgi:hypothetical protein